MKAKRVQIGTVGIDAGMLYLGDPCYIVAKPLGRKPWGEFLRDMWRSQLEGSNARWWHVEGSMGDGTSFPAGVVTTTGHGDGEYPVYVEIATDGSVKSVTVEFLR